VAEGPLGLKVFSALDFSHLPPAWPRVKGAYIGLPQALWTVKVALDSGHLPGSICLPISLPPVLLGGLAGGWPCLVECG
jgi:hypothetical protein